MSFLCVEAALFPELTAQGAQGEVPSHAVSYVGSKRKLLDWIVEQIPDGTTSAVDAVSGGSRVGYRLKTEGLAVHANDSLHWPFRIARAVVVNQGETLDEDEIAALCEKNPDAGSFVRDTYKGLFWKPEIHGVIDHVRANVEELTGFQQDLALAALGATMLSARGWFPQFTTSKVSKDGYDTAQFHARLGDVIRRLNSMVFEGEICSASRQDVRRCLKGRKADLAYFDPPYITEYSATNYSAIYHTVEAVMVGGVGRKPDPDSATRQEKTQPDLTKDTVGAFFGEVLDAAAGMPTWLLSYRDHSHPTQKELKALFTDRGRQVALKTKSFSYGPWAGKRRDEAPAKAVEYLFLGTKEAKAAVKAEWAHNGDTGVARLVGALPG